jgi:MFS family permease
MRVQVLGIALAGFLLPREWNALAVCAFLGLFGFFLGMQGVIFNTLVAKVIPVERRGLLVGLRNALAGIVAAAVGGFGGWLVETNALGNGYAATFGVAFVLTMAGLSMLLLVREPEAPTVRQKVRVHERLRDVPGLLRADRDFTWYFVARALGVAGRMAVPFYLIYAKTKLEVSGAELGLLTAAFALSMAAFQFVWGVVADRTGFRATFLVALATWASSTLLLLLTADFGWLLVVFAALGAGQGGFMLSSQNLVLEFGSRENLPLRIALANTTSEAVGVVGPIAAGLLADSVSYTPVFAIAIACQALAFAIMLTRVSEPRRRVRVGG